MEYLFYALFVVIGWLLAKIDSFKRTKLLIQYSYRRGAEDLIALAKEEQEKSTQKVGFSLNLPTMNNKDTQDD